MIYLIGAIATIVIGKPWLQPDAASANPTLDNAIALQIDNLKQSDNKWIEIDLRDQQLFAWSGEEQTFSSVVSTGKAKTPTYPGIYAIQRKYPQDRMRGRDYDIPDVPHVLYFDRGYALHGAYWHNSFGTPISHGCINLPIDYAQQLFDWAEIGTTVIIHE
ncbi:MAG: L,D-transpeptidase [Cyanobacteria bacterium P01_G01_bin.19]